MLKNLHLEQIEMRDVFGEQVPQPLEDSILRTLYTLIRDLGPLQRLKETAKN